MYVCYFVQESTNSNFVLYFVICAISSDVATLWLRDAPLAMCVGQRTNTLAKKPRWEQTQQKRLRKNNAITTMKVYGDFKEIVIRCIYDEIYEY